MADRKIFANQGPTKPSVPKSFFDLSHANNLTCRFGRAYPIFCYEAPPSSSFTIKPRFAFDFMPLVKPIQSNIRAHVKFYKIPMRIVWKHMRDFQGQHGPNGSTINQYVMPYISRSENWATTGSLADYMGLPTEVISSFQTDTSVSPSPVVSNVNINSDYFGNMLDMVGPLLRGATFTGRPPVSNLAPNVENASLNGLISALAWNKQTEYSGVFVRFDKNLLDSTNSLIFEFFSPDSLTFSASSVFDLSFSTRLFEPGTIHDVHTETYSYSTTPGTGYNLLSSDTVTVSGSFVNRYRLCLNLSSDQAKDLSSVNGFDSHVVGYLQWLNPLFGSVNDNNFTPSSTPKASELARSGSLLSQDAESTVIDSKELLFSYFLGFKGITSFQYTSSHNITTGASDKFSSIDGQPPVLPINALPFRAYEFIGNYFFRNERITPFMKDGHPVFNEFITNDGDGADSTTPVDFFKVPYEYDLFTTCVKEPQFGAAPLVGITVNDMTDTAVFHMTNPDSEVGDYTIGVDTSNEGKIVGVSYYDSNANETTIERLKEAIKFGISINDFRNVNALQRFQERYMKAGTKYQNIVYEFFGVNPPIGEEYPEWIGGCTRDVYVSKIQNTALSADAELGEFAGSAVMRGEGKPIKCFCTEYSYIIGILYFTVTPSYPQMLPKHFLKSQLLDYFNPQFANIGPQPVYKKQLAPLQLSNAKIDEVFGYNRPYSEYVSMQDEVHGNYRTNMQNYLLQRQFGTPPELNEKFLYIDSSDLTDIFSVITDSDKIFGQVYLQVHAKLPIPRFSVPRII